MAGNPPARATPVPISGTVCVMLLGVYKVCQLERGNCVCAALEAAQVLSVITAAGCCAEQNALKHCG